MISNFDALLAAASQLVAVRRRVRLTLCRVARLNRMEGVCPTIC